MAAVELLDFQDIYTAVMEKLKIPTSDTTTRDRIKRFVNITYEDLASRHNWYWLREATNLQTAAQIETGTVSVTQNSTTITFSSAPSASVAEYKFKANGYAEVYTIDAHTAGATTATLNVAYKGDTDTSASYALWKDFVELPIDARETIGGRHDHFKQPMEAMGLDEFRRVVAQQEDREQKPLIYTTDDFNAGGQRVLRYWPARDDDGLTLHIDYLHDITTLDLDGDEPLVPQQHRMVLLYGALAHAWDHERNEEQANKYWQLYEKKISEMAAKMEDSTGHAQLKISQGYMQQKRRRRGYWEVD